jgi:hypothetical protein
MVRLKKRPANAPTTPTEPLVPPGVPLVTRVRGKTGRPKLVPNMEAVKRLAAQGLNDYEVSQALGISYKALQRRRVECKEFDAAWEEGRILGLAKVTNALFQMAVVDHNVAAAIFYLKNRAPEAWRDKVEIQNELTLPAPMIIQTIKNITPPQLSLGQKDMP